MLNIKLMLKIENVIQLHNREISEIITSKTMNFSNFVDLLIRVVCCKPFRIHLILHTKYSASDPD